MKVTATCIAVVALVGAATAAPNPRPTALAVRQDASASTVAPITSTYDPSQGINGNGCSGSSGQDNVLLCCPEGYSNRNVNGEVSCVASSSGFTNVVGGDTQVFGSQGDSDSSATRTRNGDDDGSSNQTIGSGGGSGSSSSSSSSSPSATPSGKNGNGAATMKSSASVIAVGVLFIGAVLV